MCLDAEGFCYCWVLFGQRNFLQVFGSVWPKKFSASVGSYLATEIFCQCLALLLSSILFACIVTRQYEMPPLKRNQ